jgi:hypothetical protein
LVLEVGLHPFSLQEPFILWFTAIVLRSYVNFMVCEGELSQCSSLSFGSQQTLWPRDAGNRFGSQWVRCIFWHAWLISWGKIGL